MVFPNFSSETEVILSKTVAFYLIYLNEIRQLMCGLKRLQVQDLLLHAKLVLQINDQIPNSQFTL